MADIINFESKRKDRERQSPAWGSYDAAQGTLDPDQRRVLKREGGLIWRRLEEHPGKLKLKDRIQIARNLHDLKEKHRIKTSELIKAADLEDYGAKEWYRLALPPGGDPKKHHLRAHKTNYMRLIEGIHRLTGVPRSIIAEDVCRYTSLHSGGSKDLTRDEKVFYALQSWAARISEEHGLLKLYRATTEARVRLLARDGRLRWPTFPDFEIGGWSNHEFENADLDPKYAFWPADRAAERRELRWYELIPYLPHVFLGFSRATDFPSGYDDSYYVPAPDKHWERKFAQMTLEAADNGPRIEWDTSTDEPRFLVNGNTWEHFEQRLWEARDAYFADLWETRQAEGASLESELQRAITIPSTNLRDVDWRPRERFKYVAAYLRRIGKPLDLSTYVNFLGEGEDSYEVFDRYIPSMNWLVLYPEETGQEIIPVYMRVELDDPQYIKSFEAMMFARDLEVLNENNLPCFNNGSPEEYPTLLKRIEEMVTDRTIPEEWDRTASFLQYNPILHEQRHEDERDRAIEAALDDALNRPRYKI